MRTKTLSDKRYEDLYNCEPSWFYPEKDVKQFIKEIIKLRDWYINNSLDHNHEEDCITCQIIDDLQDLLNKAGNKLIEQKQEAEK